MLRKTTALRGIDVLRLLPVPLGLVALLAVGAGVTASAPDKAPERTGRELYNSACMACHASDGTGQPRNVVGFADPLPDFTDCSFTSREPDGDWFAVAHEGGPARGFSELMPAFGDALSDEELAAALEYVRTFCDEPHRWPRGNLNFPRAFYTSKAFIEDEMVVATSVNTSGDRQVLTKIIAETRVGGRGQIEAIVPFGFLEKGDGSGAWTGGIGDMKLATKWVLLHSLRAGSILSAGVELILPTGREDRGMGKGAWMLEPFLAYGQALPADAFVQVHVGAEASVEPDKAGHEAFWRLATGMTFAENSSFGRAWTPMVEILGGMDIEGGATPSWDVAPQLLVALPTRQHILLSLGARIPIDDFNDRPIAAFMFLLWDWYDGGVAEGW